MLIVKLIQSDAEDCVLRECTQVLQKFIQSDHDVYTGELNICLTLILYSETVKFTKIPPFVHAVIEVYVRWCSCIVWCCN